jgi:hypothetical protein
VVAVHVTEDLTGKPVTRGFHEVGFRIGVRSLCGQFPAAESLLTQPPGSNRVKA